MKVTGIVVEYNPFHYGHLHHLQQARVLSDCDILIAVMSPNIVQRGELSCFDKFSRAEIALDHGVDIVLELPAIYVLQNASLFAEGAVKMLADFGVDTIVFGSECNNIEYLQTLAELNINVDHIKELMKQGVSYPNAIGSLTSAMYPNDILGIAYLKALSKYPSIKAITIQRTNQYHEQDLSNKIASATAIRKGLANAHNVDNFTPMNTNSLNFVNNELLFPMIKTQLIMSNPNQLSKYLLVDEGVENLLIEAAFQASDYDSLIDYCTNRRYTKSRIQRTILCILFQVTKEEKKHLENEAKSRVLGFNNQGRSYLRLVDQQHYGTVYQHLPIAQRKLEYRITTFYSMVSNNPSLIAKELAGPIKKAASSL
jgi:predicted nucleotidyltransferase